MKKLEYALFQRQTTLQNARDQYSERIGIYLKYNDFFLGEAAPLPGFSRESVSDCLNQLLAPENRESMLALIESGIGGERFLPALRFALESIYYSLRTDQKRAPLFCAALVTGFPSEKAQVESGAVAIKKGFRHLKIKISNVLGLDSLLTKLQSNSQEPLFFRLDANYSLSAEQTKAISKNLSLKNLSRIEYLEDPYQNFQADQYDFPLAVDQDIGEQSFSDPSLVYVVKPSVQVGLVGLEKRLSAAKMARVKVILSSSLETEVGLVALRNFCRQFADLSLAHGLSTASILSNPELTDEPRYDEKCFISAVTMSRLNQLTWKTV